MTTVLIRADSSTSIGTGHITRMRTLASELHRNGFHVLFAVRELCNNIEGFTVIEVEGEEVSTLCSLIEQHAVSLVIFDHYGIGAEEEKELQCHTGVKIMSIDDTLQQHHCDLLLNQNVFAKSSLYDTLVSSYCRVLAGPNYALLRDEFSEQQPRDRSTIDQQRVRILITLGGTDPDNATLKVLQACEQIEKISLQVKVVVGSGNRHFENLSQFVSQTNKEIELLTDVSAMAPLMQWADLAVCAGGTTSLEILKMQVPSLTLTLADNQEKTAQALEEKGFSQSLGWVDQLSSSALATAIEELALISYPTQIHHMQNLQMKNGKAAVVQEIKQLLFSEYQLRSATVEDRENIFQLSNEPTVRECCCNSETIEWDSHCKWFMEKLNDKRCCFYIVTNCNGHFLGQVRFEEEPVDPGVYTISISLGKKMQGCGFSSAIIKKAEQQLRKERDVKKITAVIKRGNEPSIKAFRKASYRLEEEGESAAPPKERWHCTIL